MVPGSILLGVAITWVAAAHALDGAAQQDGIVLLACNGTLIAGDAPASRIEASGTVDFTRMQVRGFGLGAAPIVFASAEEIRFGASPLAAASASQTIEGSIDRATGRTQIRVRSPRDPGRDLIAMTLDCRLTPQVS